MIEESEAQEIIQHGIELEDLLKQIQLLQSGVPEIHVDRPATLNDGIIQTDTKLFQYWLTVFDDQSKHFDCCKFVPASGAATRMFQDLQQFLGSGTINANCKQFIDRLADFSFVAPYYEELKFKTKEQVIQFILNENGLNLVNLPKALINFHFDNGSLFTPLASHIIEAIEYSTSTNGIVQLHFTFSEHHREKLLQKIKQLNKEISEQYHIELQLESSLQKASTDTIVLNEDGKIACDLDGKVIFRPGGHGSLLANLNELNHDLIFIRNIDNVLPPSRNAESVFYKKVMAGCLIDFRNQLKTIIAKVENNYSNSINELLDLAKKFQFAFNPAIFSVEKTQIIKFFNRPIRVCGMVKNEGQPGGGPYWVRKNDELSLQIVEASQFNKILNAEKITSEATHFNPVDMVVLPLNLNNEKLNLNNYCDLDTSFITDKMIGNHSMKVLERPGLWNGAMSDWITIFIEIPASIFNPVKTVNDLLSPNHLGK